MTLKIVITIFALLLSSFYPSTVYPQQNQSIATNLIIPWQIVKSGETFYLTERIGNIVEIKNGKMRRTKVQLTKSLMNEGEGGLLGFQLAPSSNTIGYIYYTYQEGNKIYNRVVTVQKRNNQWVENKTLIDRIPGAYIHNGGRMKIGPDNKLYITTGDASQQMLAQNKNSLAGKILRVELNGQVPKDNPFRGSFVYSYGHRNPQGLAWNEEGTKLYASEHGPVGFDEINEIISGGNYGWPVIKGNESRPYMKSPLFHSGNQTWAPAGIALKDNKIYVATLRGEKVLMFDLQRNNIQPLFSNVGRLRDVLLEKNILYIVTSNRDGRGNPAPNDDRLIKIEGMIKE